MAWRKTEVAVKGAVENPDPLSRAPGLFRLGHPEPVLFHSLEDKKGP